MSRPFGNLLSQKPDAVRRRGILDGTYKRGLKSRFTYAIEQRQHILRALLFLGKDLPSCADWSDRSLPNTE